MFTPFQKLKEAIGIFSANPRLYIRIYLPILLITFVLLVAETLVGASEALITVWVFARLLILLSLLAFGILMAIATLHAIAGHATTAQEAYAMARGQFWKYIGLSITQSIVLIIAFILLIIPGVIVSIWLVFSYMVLVLEGRGVVACMKQSKHYVKGHWWVVFGYMVFIFVVSALVGTLINTVSTMLATALPVVVANFLVLVANAIVVPITVAFVYLVYRDLKASKTVEPAMEQPQIV